MSERSWADVGAILKHRREVELGLTQPELADKSGLSVPMIQVLEGGRRESFSGRTLGKISRGLDWPSDAVQRLRAGEPPEALAVVAAPTDGRSLELVVASLLSRSGVTFDETRSSRGPDLQVLGPDGRPVLIEVKAGTDQRDIEAGVGQLLFHAFDAPQPPIMLLVVKGEVSEQHERFARESDVRIVAGATDVDAAQRLVVELARVGALPDVALAADRDDLAEGAPSSTPAARPQPEPNE